MNVSKAIFLKMEKESPKVKYNIINLVDELSTDYCKVFTVQNNANNKLHIMYSYLKTKSDKDNSYIFQEAFILSNYTHENMTRLFNFYEGIDNYSLVFEYVDLKYNLNKINKLEEYKVKIIVYQLLSFINYFHSNKICHRSLNLDKIFFSNYESLTIKLFDLSKAKHLTKNNFQTNYQTAAFSAPEILSNVGYSYEADIWSIGIIMFQVIFGHELFQTKLHDEKAISTYILDKFSNKNFSISDHILSFKNNNVSNLGIDILILMLNLDKKNRITAKDALNHPYFNELKIEKNLLNLPKCLKFNFQKNTLIKKLFTYYSAYYLLHPFDFNEKIQIFKSIDKNNSGVITNLEIIKSIKQLGKNHYFEICNSILSNWPNDTQNLDLDLEKFIFCTINSDDMIKKLIKNFFEDFKNVNTGNIDISSVLYIFDNFEYLDDVQQESIASIFSYEKIPYSKLNQEYLDWNKFSEKFSDFIDN